MAEINYNDKNLYPYGKEGLQGGQTINSTVLNPLPSNYLQTNLVQPPINPVPDISNLNSDITNSLTQPETQASELVKRLQNLYLENTGQSTFKVQQEQAQGIPGLEKVQTDLAAQLKALQGEAQAIPLQLQNEAQGRGITTGGLAPIQTERLRENAIKSLGVSSLLEASRGNLALANDLVDRAVKAQFDPIKEQIAATEANLKLIINSPEFTLADKNRAIKQAERQANLQRIVDAQELDKKRIWEIAVQAANNGVDSLTLKKIQDSKSAQDALSIVSRATVIGTSEAPTIKSINGVDMQWNPVAQKWETPVGGISAGQQTSYKAEIASTGRQAVRGLLDIAIANPDIFGRSASVPVPDFLRSDAFRNYRAQLDYLKGNIIPAALTAMREASKTGGALGQVSDREGAWLGSSLGALDMAQSPSMVIKQLRLIDSHLKAWQTAVEQYESAGGTTITAPDGTEVQIID